MKIAIYSDNFYPEISGTSDSIITTAKELASRGHKLNFYVPSHPKKNFLISNFEPKELDLGPNVEIFRIPSLPYPAPSKAGRLVFPLLFTYRHIKKFNPDLIHINHLFGACLEGMFVSRLLKAPLIGTNHHTMSEFMKYGPIKTKWAERAMLKYVSWLFNKCVWVSSPCRAIISEMKRYGFKRESGTMSNPINVSNFNPVEISTKVELKKKFNLTSWAVLYTGRLAEEKKVDDIIRAIAIVRKKYPDISLAVTGLGSGEKSLKKLTKELNLEKNVSFFGYVDINIFPQFYQASDIFAVMSTAETQCISMMQAMATGIPVIGANSWGLPDYINSENGYLVEPGDVKTLAKKITYLLENPKERERLGQGGLKYVQKFGIKNIADEWEKIFDKFSNKHRPE